MSRIQQFLAFICPSPAHPFAKALRFTRRGTRSSRRSADQLNGALEDSLSDRIKWSKNLQSSYMGIFTQHVVGYDVDSEVIARDRRSGMSIHPNQIIHSHRLTPPPPLLRPLHLGYSVVGVYEAIHPVLRIPSLAPTEIRTQSQVRGAALTSCKSWMELPALIEILEGVYESSRG